MGAEHRPWLGPRLGDLIIVTASLALIAGLQAFLLHSPRGVMAERAIVRVEQRDGPARVEQLKLIGPATLRLDTRAGPLVVQARSHGVRIAQASCPHRYCMAQGWVSRPGHVIACLPSGVSVGLEAPRARGRTLDSIVY